MIPILDQDKTMTLIVLPTPPSISLSHGSSSGFSLAEDLTLELYSCNHICMDEIGPDWRWERYSRVFCRGTSWCQLCWECEGAPRKNTLSRWFFICCFQHWHSSLWAEYSCNNKYVTILLTSTLFSSLHAFLLSHLPVLLDSITCNLSLLPMRTKTTETQNKKKTCEIFRHRHKNIIGVLNHSSNSLLPTICCYLVFCRTVRSLGI